MSDLTEQQAEKIQKLAGLLKFVSFGFALIAVGHGLGLVEHLVARDEDKKLISMPLFMGLKNVLTFGIVFTSFKDASQELKQVVRSKGSTTTDLMNGVDSMIRGFNKLKMPLLIMGITGLVEHLKAFRQ